MLASVQWNFSSAGRTQEVDELDTEQVKHWSGWGYLSVPTWLTTC